MIEAKFKQCDCIVNRIAGDIGIVKGITKKGYYQFKHYYEEMLHEMKDLKKYPYELQVNYQKYWDLCNEEEKNKIETKIKNNETQQHQNSNC